MEAGQLVPDHIVLGMIEERLSHKDVRKGFILDGFPRNIPQAQALDELLDKVHQPLDATILIDVDLDVLIQRITGRRTCLSCGQVYNIYTSPSRLDDRCDKCGGDLHHRMDDNEETIGNRLRIYEAQTTPLINYYRQQGKLKNIQGVGEIDDIFTKLITVLDRLTNIKPEKQREESTKMSTAKKKTATKKAAPKKKAAATKKKAVATKKKAAVTKKKAAAKKKTATKKKAAVKKKTATKKKAAAKKK
ncbi:MAG: hypothetical protein A2V90_01350 [Gammaproteobacteria bacterium RBG_16_57_12]|nr:MAG: hypothetical protein A2V90_01350 [Gammaproteobacteria bacterium RBG_16_57_12]